MDDKPKPDFFEGRSAHVAVGSELMTYEMLGLWKKASEDLPGASHEMLMSYSRLLYAERAEQAKKRIDKIGRY